MDTNPTPRAYLGDSYDSIKTKKTKVSLRTKDLTQPENVEEKEVEWNKEIIKKIISTTHKICISIKNIDIKDPK